MSRSRGFFVFFCVRDAVATRGQYLAVDHADHWSYGLQVLWITSPTVYKSCGSLTSPVVYNVLS